MLDNLGYVKSHCGIQNDDKIMSRLKSQLELAASIAEVKRDCIQNEEMAAKKARNDLQSMAPVAAKNIYGKEERDKERHRHYFTRSVWGVHQ